MTYFVTGATGFIGRHLVERLLEREGDIYVLTREGSTEKLERLRALPGAADRIKPVFGDLAQPQLGIDDSAREQLAGVDHFFHLAAIYDITADEALLMGLVNEVVPAGAHLARALELAEAVAAFPQETMLSDREAAHASLGLPIDEGLALEARLGRGRILAALEGARRFGERG